MGAIVFDNNVFDSWLTTKSQEILSKVDKERISTEDMMVLVLKAQTNHFHHMDQEFRLEFRKIDERFNKIEKRIDERFERVFKLFMWQTGAIATLFAGIYLKLFLG
jgi:DNA-binding ferritin-like protein